MLGMEEVCGQLDSVLLEVMGALQELSQLRERYSEAVREGYITMAQARHAMGGPKTVSSLQYDAVMSPLVTLEVSKEAERYEDVMKAVDLSGDVLEFKVHRVVPGKPVKQSRLSSKSDENGSSLRQRKNVAEVSQKPQGVEDVAKAMTSLKLEDKKEESGTFESKEEEAKDPIKWFGVLVPQTLRQSQQHFIKAIDYTARLAGTQVKLEALRRRYRELLAKKELLKTKAASEQ